jgi:hypothetical protein
MSWQEEFANRGSVADQLQNLLETRGPIGNPIIKYIGLYDLLIDLRIKEGETS